MVRTEVHQDETGNITMTVVYPKDWTIEKVVLWLLQKKLAPGDQGEYENPLSEPAAQVSEREAVAAR